MAKIIRFNENKYFNLDERTLYVNGSKSGSALKGIPFRILELLANNSPNLITQDQIREKCWKEDLGEGSVPYHILKLRKAIQDERIIGTRNYKYIIETDGMYSCSSSITDTSSTISLKEHNETIQPCDSRILYKELLAFVDTASKLQNGLLNSLLYCGCKWGSCTYDTETQNTNTCEGLLALLISNEHLNHTDLIEECLFNLSETIEEKGLLSKSLGMETVVPTSMYIYISSLYKGKIDKERIIQLSKILYLSKEQSGWGIYVKQMGRNTNIGCTYWALIALLSNDYIDSNLVQKTIVSLFKYNKTNSFGRNIDEINPRIPCLYATSMMFILYLSLSPINRKLVGTKFDYKKALDIIVKYFDNPFFLIEDEGISGIEIPDRINVHTVNWNHITIHYSLKALSMAMLNGIISNQEINSILQRISVLYKENCQGDDNKRYWNDPKISIEKGNRGKLIFPTMHAIMGLANIIDAVKQIINDNLEE